MMEKLRKGEKANIVADQWNSPTLNTNLAEMLTEILERKITGIYHSAGATRINRYDFAKPLNIKRSLEILKKELIDKTNQQL